MEDEAAFREFVGARLSTMSRVAYLPEGIPLIHYVPVGDDDPQEAKVTGVEFADPQTGARVEAMSVSGTVAMMVVRGSTN